MLFKLLAKWIASLASLESNTLYTGTLLHMNLNKINNPLQVQKLLNTFEYNREENGETLSSALTTFKKKKAHCLEGAFLAAYILEKSKYPPLVLSLESQDKLDHVVFAYKGPQGWGSVGKSRDRGLQGRKAIFKTPKALAASYIDPFIDLTGRITAYAVVSLDECNANWRTSPRNVWKLEKFLIKVPHKKLNCSDKHYNKILTQYKNGQPVKVEDYWL